MLSDTVKQASRRIWWSLVIRALFALTLGILILVRPMDSIAAFALVIAIWALFSGITEIVHAIDIKPYFKSWWMMLLAGLVSAGFGVAALFYYPTLSLAFAVAWASFWLATTGILGVAVSMMEKKVGLSWGWTLFWSILSLAAAIAAWVSPPATIGAIMGLIAGFAIISGIVLLIAAIRIKSLEREVLQSVRQPTQPSPAT